MDKKTLSIISYVTIIGWLIAYFSSKDKRESLVTYHLKQGLGVHIFTILFSFALSIVAGIVPAVSFLGLVAYALSLIFMILGIINALNEKETPIPVIGKMFENKFAFLD